MSAKKLLLMLVFTAALTASTFAGPGVRGVRSWVAELEPLNNSGVQGIALLTLEDGVLSVAVLAEGLEADKPHAQHIHGSPTDTRNSVCPPPEADIDGDGLISVGEGLPYYGPVLLALTPFTTAPGGVIDYDGAFSDLSAIEPVAALQNRVIVIHGMTVGGGYIGSLPVACGQIRPLANGH